MTQEKEEIEFYLSKLFLERVLNIQIDLIEIKSGDAEKKEPDIFYKEMGIEIGAVLKGNNTHIDKYENEFITIANQEILGKISSNIKISLVMQDDKETVKYFPYPEFKKYKFLPLYLDGIIIDKYSSDFIVNQTIVLNQKPLIRKNTFPSITNKKIFNGFISELIDYVYNLQDNDFIISPFNSKYKTLHRPVCIGELINKSVNPLDDYISPKIIDKLKKDKYKGTHKEQFLLLHNYSILGNTEFTTDIHFYSHYREHVFNKIANLISGFCSFNFYNEIFFMDFSKYVFNMNFNIIDFKTYKDKIIKEEIINYGHIRGSINKSE